ncbi:MAG: hypothetical protein ACM3X0_14455 [Bacteroidota bacterium]
MRIKNRWFRSELLRRPRDVAGGVAFIAWRIAQQALKNMRKADFEIDLGPAYFSFLAEWLIFLIQIADRLANARLTMDERQEFTTALANRLGQILEENRSDLLIPDTEVGSYKGRFIGLLNRRAADYACHDCPETGPDYAFRRQLANELLAVVGEADRIWVHDQIMEIEAPDAAATLRRGVLGLLDQEARPNRPGRGLSGD